MACVMARMWASVNVPCSDEPRWPLVPKLTNWLGSLGSGRRSKYSRSSRARSTRSCIGAGWPARGEIGMGHALSGPVDDLAAAASRSPLLRILEQVHPLPVGRGDL